MTEKLGFAHHPASTTNFLRNLTRLKAARCMRACKVFGRNRTKMFHVKQFGTIFTPNRTVRGAPTALRSNPPGRS
jgi:hypothetical protein